MAFNGISKKIKQKSDQQWRIMANEQSQSTKETPSGTVYLNDPTEYTQTIAAGKNITISVAGNTKTINAVMGLLAGSNISISEPDANGKVTITGTIAGKGISIADFTGKDGFVLSYNAISDAFELAEVASSYDLPQATDAVLGGIKAKAKTTETSEITIDPATGKLYGPAPDAAANGIPQGGTAGQVLSKIDGTDYNATWRDLTASDIAITDTAGHYTASDVEGALSELFTNVSNGKTLIAAAITDKGVTTSANDTFGTMASNIVSISGKEQINTLTLNPTKDAYTYQASSATNYGSSNRLDVSAISSYRSYAFMEFDISSIPLGADIRSAKLCLYKTYSNDNGHVLVYTLRRVTSAWVENTITYNVSPTYSARYGQPYAFGAINEWSVIDLKSMVQEWIDGTYSNYGIALIPEFSLSGSSYDYRHHGGYATKEHATEAYRPYLVIEYV